MGFTLNIRYFWQRFYNFFRLLCNSIDNMTISIETNDMFLVFSKKCMLYLIRRKNELYLSFFSLNHMFAMTLNKYLNHEFRLFNEFNESESDLGM